MSRVLLLTGLPLAALCATTLLGCATNPDRPDDPAYSSTSSGKADSDSAWCHADFKSVEGASIRVDFQIKDQENGSEYTQLASPAWLNVQSDALTSANSVRVWIGDEGYSTDEGYDTAAEYNAFSPYPDAQLDLYRSEDPTRFTGQLASGLSISNYYEGDDIATLHAHQFAVVIDGAWQTDPISGTHNFVAKYLGQCGTGD